MGNPKYSVIAPAIRSYLYQFVCENIQAGSGGIPYEIIFAGDVPPVEKMPDNFRYIFTEVCSWPQCLEIAARHATGEYLVIAFDDGVFSPGFIQRIDYYSHRFDMNKTFIAFRYQQNGTYVNDSNLVVDQAVKNSPIVGVGGVFQREMWYKLGGFDRRFPGAMADIDMVYRLYEKGYNLFIPPDLYVNERRNSDMEKYRPSMCISTGLFGLKILHKLWFQDKLFLNSRQDALWPYTDDTILTHEQFKMDPMDRVMPTIEFKIENFRDRHQNAIVKMLDGPLDREYDVEFVNLSDHTSCYKQSIRAHEEVTCFLDITKKVRIRVGHQKDGLVFQKTIKCGEDNNWKEC